MMRRLWDRVASRRIAALLAIFLVSLTISLIISGLGFFVRYGDSVTYTQYARDLLSGHVDSNLYYRTPGYPILLILTGAMAGSFAGLLTAQAVAGAMIPAASYWAVERFSWQVAFLVAGFSIGSMVPFIYINLLYPDEAYIVLLVLSCVFLVRWLAFPDASRINLYALAAASDLLAWMRPIGLTVTGTCLLLAALKRRSMIPWLVCVIAIGGVHLGWHLYKVHHTWRGEDNASMLGRQLFFKAYMWSDGQEAGFSPDQGPATVALRRRIVEFFADKERKAEIEKRWGAIRQWTAPMSDEAYKEMFARFDGRPDAQVAEIFALPNAAYFNVLFVAADVAFGPDSDQLFLRASIEQFMAHPMQLLSSIVGSYWGFVWGPAWQFSYYNMPSLVSSPILDTDWDPPLFQSITPVGAQCMPSRRDEGIVDNSRCRPSQWIASARQLAFIRVSASPARLFHSDVDWSRWPNIRTHSGAHCGALLLRASYRQCIILEPVCRSQIPLPVRKRSARHYWRRLWRAGFEPHRS